MNSNLTKEASDLTSGHMMVSENSHSKTTGPKDFSSSLINIQKLVFYLSLVLIPVAILPLPWDWSEYGRTLLFFVFAVLIVGLEIIKTIFYGRFSIFKGPLDFGILAILVSVIVSTILSVSFSISLFGFDNRMSLGLLGISSIMLYSYVARSFITTVDDISNAISSLLIGSALGSLLGIFSFMGVNILRFVPAYRELLVTGLTIFASSNVALVFWGAAVILGVTFLISNSGRNKMFYFVTASITTFINIIGILLYSAKQGLPIYLLIVASVIAIAVSVAYKQKTKQNGLAVISMIAGILLIGFFLLKIPQVYTAIPNSSNISSQVTLSVEGTWRVVARTLSGSISTGVFGLGNDTFNIAFNLYKPLVDNGVDLNLPNYSFGNNEMLTITSNRGLLGFGVWVFFGVLIGIMVVKDFKDKALSYPYNTFVVGTDVLLVYIYIASLFTYFPFILYFLMFIAVSFNTVVRSIANLRDAESFVFQYDVLIEKIGQTRFKYLHALASVIVFGIAGLMLFMIAQQMISISYALEAERITSEARAKFNQNQLIEDERLKVLANAVNLYGRAINIQPSNYVFYNRTSLLLTEYVVVLSNKYKNTEDTTQKDNLYTEISRDIEISIETSKKSTEIAPVVYSNWSTRGYVYSQFVDLGLTNYIKSALESLGQASALNPLNYTLQFNIAQLDARDNKLQDALISVKRSLDINPNYVPSLMLAAELDVSLNNPVEAKNYLNQIKSILENNGQKDSDLYKQVVSRMDEIDNPSAPVNPPAPAANTSNSTTTTPGTPSKTP